MLGLGALCIGEGVPAHSVSGADGFRSPCHSRRLESTSWMHCLLDRLPLRLERCSKAKAEYGGRGKQAWG